MDKSNYPIAGIVGQEKLIRGLMILQTSPFVKSLLICGEKGSGKSRTVRAFGKDIAQGLMEVPLGVTEDNLFGGVPISQDANRGIGAFQKGILGRMKPGKLLYIDEINLFSQELLASILNAMEWEGLLVEREGFSEYQTTKMKVVGTMNSEEGFLSSGLADRFAIYVETQGILDKEMRKQVIYNNLRFTKEPSEFAKDKEALVVQLQNQLKRAKALLNRIQLSDDNLAMIQEITAAAHVKGYRGDFYMAEVARAIAALAGRTKILSKDIEEAAEFVLPHRKNDFNEQSLPKEKNSKQENSEKDPSQHDLSEHQDPKEMQQDSQEGEQPSELKDNTEVKENEASSSQRDSLEENEEQALAQEIYKIKKYIQLPEDRIIRKGTGKRNKTWSSKKGKAVRSSAQKGEEQDISLIGTIKAAIINGNKLDNGHGITIKDEDIRYKKRKSKVGSSIIFLVDSSGSMGVQKRMVETKNGILSLLNDSYQKREQVAMVSFSGEEARLLLPFTRSVTLAKRELQDIKTGGESPLSMGLLRAKELFEHQRRKQGEMIPILIVITDGRGNYAMDQHKDPIEEALAISGQIKESGIHCVVLDTEVGFVRLEIPRRLSKELGGEYYRLEDLRAKDISDIVRKSARGSLSRINIMEDKA